jgi:hypothetical protein
MRGRSLLAGMGNCPTAVGAATAAGETGKSGVDAEPGGGGVSSDPLAKE